MAVQLRAAQAYRRELARIENDRRAAIWMLHQEHGGERLVDMEARLRVSSERTVWDESARAEHSAIASALSAMRTAIDKDPRVKAARAAIDAMREHERKIAYANRECSWGTAALVGRAHDQSLKPSPDRPNRNSRLYDDGRPNPMRWPRFDGCGQLRVQLMGGASPTAILGASDTQVQIVRRDRTPAAGRLERVIRNGDNAGKTLADVLALHPEARPTPVNADRQAKRDFRILRLRIGSEEREPVWAEWPMMYDRPLPAGGVVKQVVVRSMLVAQRVVWTVQFFVELAVEPAALGMQDAVAIDVGWRKLGTGLRVAYGHGHDGRDWPLVLPDAWIGRMRYADSVRSLRDAHFKRVVARLRELRASLEERPEWFSRETETLHAWRSPRSIVRLARMWQANRFAGDDLFDTLEWWDTEPYDVHWRPGWRPGVLGYLRQDRRLWAVEAGVRRKACGERKALVEDQVQSYRQPAAVSELREVLRSTFRREGGCGSACVEAMDSTHECYACGQVDAFDAARELAHTCSRCGRIWDQDANAARVLLARERWCDAQSTARARVRSKVCVCHEKKESHFAKLKRLKSERLAREEVARNAPPTLAE